LANTKCCAELLSLESAIARLQVLRNALVSNPDPDDSVLLALYGPALTHRKHPLPLWSSHNRGPLREAWAENH
jgi:hypothetical protein